MLVDEEVIGPSRSPKRTVSCFGKGKRFYLLTSIQGSTILYGTQSVGKLVLLLYVLTYMFRHTVRGHTV